jgi:hypothetical protein
MPLPDFSNLSLTALCTLLVLTAFFDVAWNIVLAIVHGDFSASYVADFIRSHVLLRVFPIAGLGILGHGIPTADVPSIPPLTLAATGALAAYVVETAWSMVQALNDTRPVPSPPTPTPEG